MLQVHLSDDEGMYMLATCLRFAACYELHGATVQSEVSPRATTRKKRIVPKVVVRGEVAVPRPSNVFEWTEVRRSRRVNILCI